MSIVRKTKPVAALIKIFDEAQNALSVVELVENLKSRMNKTTVYRILDRFENEGILHSFTDKDGLKYYAKCHGCSHLKHEDAHPHFQCKDCGKIECLDMEVSIPKLSNYKIDTTDILLIGQCESCLD